MKTTIAVVAAVAVLTGLLSAQETKKVPKDSMRVSIPGCTKGRIFTAGRRSADQPGSADIPEGTHLRMNGAKKIMTEIKAHEGAMIEITGLMKKDQYEPGVRVGGVRVAPGATPTGGSVSASPNFSQNMIDVEGWRPAVGNCPSGQN